jgi:uncharacterized CHY-type Zn-finger protein
MIERNTVLFCTICHHELTYDEKLYSDGVCPYCGFSDKKNSTIVSTYEKNFKWVETNYGWKFWKPKREKVFID